MDAAREVAQLRERLAGRAAPRRRAAARPGVGRELLLGHAEAHAERDEPRLRAVVQVALDPPQLASCSSTAPARVASSTSTRSVQGAGSGERSTAWMPSGYRRGRGAPSAGQK